MPKIDEAMALAAMNPMVGMSGPHHASFIVNVMNHDKDLGDDGKILTGVSKSLDMDDNLYGIDQNGRFFAKRKYDVMERKDIIECYKVNVDCTPLIEEIEKEVQIPYDMRPIHKPSYIYEVLTGHTLLDENQMEYDSLCEKVQLDKMTAALAGVTQGSLERAHNIQTGKQDKSAGYIPDNDFPQGTENMSVPGMALESFTSWFSKTVGPSKPIYYVLGEKEKTFDRLFLANPSAALYDYITTINKSCKNVDVQDTIVLDRKWWEANNKRKVYFITASCPFNQYSIEAGYLPQDILNLSDRIDKPLVPITLGTVQSMYDITIQFKDGSMLEGYEIDSTYGLNENSKPKFTTRVVNKGNTNKVSLHYSSPNEDWKRQHQVKDTKNGHEEITVEKWEQNGQDLKNLREVANTKFYVEGETMYTLDEESGYRPNPIVFSDDDVYINFDNFVDKKEHVLLITGLSGSGKSTLGQKLADKYNAYYVETDIMAFSLMKEKNRTWDYIKEHDKMLYQYLKVNNYTIDFMSDITFANYLTTKKKDWDERLNNYIKWLISGQKERVVIGGGAVGVFLQNNPQYSYVPTIFKGTSLFKSIWRRVNRSKDNIFNQLKRAPVTLKQYQDMWAEIKNSRINVMSDNEWKFMKESVTLEDGMMSLLGVKN